MFTTLCFNCEISSHRKHNSRIILAKNASSSLCSRFRARARALFRSCPRLRLCAAHAKGKACLLTIAALFGFGLNAFADGAIDIANPTSGSGYTWDADAATLTITGNGNYTFTGNASSPTSHRIAVASALTAVNITLNSVSISSSGGCAFEVGSGATVLLTLTGSSTLQSGGAYAGLQVPSGAALTIAGDGALTATGGKAGGAGIGSRANGGESGHIIINSGTVTAKGRGLYEAGIGGGNSGSGTITINGGTVNAEGGSNGAGIGGGGSNGGTIYINGGNVTAKGESGAGIGSGGLSYDYNGTVTITDGTIAAISKKGAGIGGGISSNGDITIKGGTVTATSEEGAGIGGGSGGSGTITINSGTIIATSDVGAGIGIGASGSGGSESEITIKGGSVTAKSSSGGAIGCGSFNPTNSKITITGGVVNASSEDGAGIGSDNNGAKSKITISGGTIAASSENGAAIEGNAKEAITIDGGSVKVSNPSTLLPKNSSSIPVYLNELTLDHPPVEDTLIVGGSIDGVPCNAQPYAAGGVYGVNGVETDAAGKLYFWLPEADAPEIISVTAAANATAGSKTTYDNLLSRKPSNSNADTLYRSPAAITSVTSANANEDTVGVVTITFSRPMPTGNTGDTVMLVCRECLTPQVLLPESSGAWSSNGRRYEIPFSGLEFSSTYRVYAAGFRDTIGRTVERDTAYTFHTRKIQAITAATYENTELPYTVGNIITAEKGAYEAHAGGDEGNHAYQWLRSDDDDNAGAGTAIPGANTTSYTPGAEDFGKYIYIETTPVGSEGHQARPVASEKIRIGVRVAGTVSGAHGGTVLLPNGKSDTVVYDASTKVKLLLHKNFPDDAIRQWSDCYADHTAAGGQFYYAPDTSYTVPAAPKGGVTLVASLALSAPKLSFPAAESITYGDALMQASLTGGECSGKGSFAWVEGNTRPKAGNASLIVAFTPADHAQDYDYSLLDGWDESDGTVKRKVEVTVEKKEISIVGGAVEQKSYDATNQATVNSLVFDGLVEGETLLPDVDYTVSSNATFDTPDVGSEKTVTLTAALTTSEVALNYTLLNGADYLLQNQAISKAAPTLDLLGYSIDDSDYTGEQQHVDVTVQDDVVGLGIITVLYNEEPELPTNAGKYVITVKIEEGDNYSSATLELPDTLTIEKAPPTLDLLGYAQENLKTTYNGSPQPADVTVQDDVVGLGDATVLYNGEATPPTNAGKYVISVEIKEGDNYSSATLELPDTLTIEKATPTRDLLTYTPEEATFDGTPKEVTVNPADDLGKITVYYGEGENVTTTPPTNAGTYPISVKIDGNDNYNADSFKLGDLIIHKTSPTLDLLDYPTNDNDFEKIYDGTTQLVDVKKQDDVVGLGDITVLYNGESERPTNAGEYVITVKIEEGDNYSSATLELPDTLTIEKAPPTLDLLGYAQENLKTTYNGSPQPADVTVQDDVVGLGDATVLYNGESTPPTNAGKYVISVEIKEGDNYSSATLELPDTLTIEKATPTRDLLGYSPEDFTATYTGKPQPVVVTVQDDAVGLGGITVLYNDDATTPTNAGEYVITVEIKEGENYSSATLDLQKTLTIEKAPPTLDLLGYAQENLKTTYNGSPQPVPAPKEVEGMGRITVLYNEEPEPPINAGDYVITVKIDETGESYSSATLELGTLTIEKATPIPDLLSYSLDDFEKTYNGEQQHVDVTVQDDVVGLGGITVLYNDDATTPTNAGDYVITVKIEDGENYTSATIELQKTLTIEKAPPILDLLSYSLDDFEKTYTGTTQPVDVKKQDDAVGLGDIATVLYNGEPELPTNAGEYIVTVEIEDGKNYTSATLELPDTLTIGKAQLKPGDLKMTPTKATYDEQQHGVTVQPRFPCDKTCADMGDVTVFYDGKTEMPVKTGEYLVTVTITEGENYQSVTTPMPLGIFQIRQPTTLRDTVCLNEAYSRHGFTLPEQAKNGLFTHADTIRGELYDSIVHLKLLVYDSILFSVDNFIACADDREAAVEFDLNENSAAPSRYSLTFGKAQRFFADNVENAPLPAAIPMLNVRPDVYSATLRLSNGKCHSKELPFTITVHYPSSIMKQKWNNVIALYKSEYEFSSYQWIKDGVEIPGATLPYLYTPPMLDFSAGYTVLLTRTDGVTLPACSCKLAPPTPQQEESIAAYPTVMDKGADITILSLQQGEAITRNTLGAGVSRQKFSAGTARIGAPAQAGVYFVELQVDGEKTKTVKILVK